MPATFNPDTDIPDLTGRVILVTGGKKHSSLVHPRFIFSLDTPQNLTLENLNTSHFNTSHLNTTNPTTQAPPA